MEGLSLNLPLLLKTIHHILVTPPNLMRQTLMRKHHASDSVYSAEEKLTHLHCAVFTARLQSENSQGLRDNHALLPVVGRGNALEELEALKSCRTASRLVRNHTANGPVENLGGSTVMERTRLFGIDDMALVEEVVVAQLQCENARPVSDQLPNSSWL